MQRTEDFINVQEKHVSACMFCYWMCFTHEQVPKGHDEVCLLMVEAFCTVCVCVVSAEDGGLGIIDLEIKNRAMLNKWIWRYGER